VAPDEKRQEEAKKVYETYLDPKVNKYHTIQLKGALQMYPAILKTPCNCTCCFYVYIQAVVNDYSTAAIWIIKFD
jgi:hypothetical protein